MLRRICIKNYKSLVDVDVQLHPLAVLFGPNAAGKSNFLDALQLLSRLATSRNVKEAFDAPYRGTPLESFSFGPRGMKDLLSRDHASFSIEVDVELSPEVIREVEDEIREMRRPPADEPRQSEQKNRALIRESSLRYSVEIEVLPRSGMLRVTNEYLGALTRDGEPKRSRSAFLERVGNRLHLRREGQAHPMAFERGLDHTILSRPLYAPHYPHMVAMRRELGRWYFFYFEPRERMRASNPVKEVRHIGLMGEELAAYLNTLKAVNERQFRGVERSLRMIIPQVTGIDVEVSDLGEVELRLREGDKPIPARLLSEGTLRVLGLLAVGSSDEVPALIGLEEPENGVHPRRIRLIAEYLKNQAASGRTQLIVTTHSSTLLDLIPEESLLSVRRRNGRTTIQPFTTWGSLSRDNDLDMMLNDEETISVGDRVLRGDFDD